MRRPATHSTVVVLPAPFGPRMPKISPSSTVNDTSSTASWSRYRLRRLLTSMTFMLNDVRSRAAAGESAWAPGRGVVTSTAGRHPATLGTPGPIVETDGHEETRDGDRPGPRPGDARPVGRRPGGAGRGDRGAELRAGDDLPASPGGLADQAPYGAREKAERHPGSVSRRRPRTCRRRCRPGPSPTAGTATTAGSTRRRGGPTGTSAGCGCSATRPPGGTGSGCS